MKKKKLAGLADDSSDNDLQEKELNLSLNEEDNFSSSSPAQEEKLLSKNKNKASKKDTKNNNNYLRAKKSTVHTTEDIKDNKKDKLRKKKNITNDDNLINNVNESRRNSNNKKIYTFNSENESSSQNANEENEFHKSSKNKTLYLPQNDNNKNKTEAYINNNTPNDFMKTETLYSKKGSMDSLFRKFIVEKKMSFSSPNNIDSCKNANNFYSFSSKDMTDYLYKNSNSGNENFNICPSPIIINDKNIKNNNVNINNNKVSNISKEILNTNNKFYDIKNKEKQSQENEGISKLKNKLSLKVKIPEEKCEKNLIENFEAHNNNNFNNPPGNHVSESQNNANNTILVNNNLEDQINENFSVVNIHGDNISIRVFYF